MSATLMRASHQCEGGPPPPPVTAWMTPHREGGAFKKSVSNIFVSENKNICLVQVGLPRRVYEIGGAGGCRGPEGGAPTGPKGSQVSLQGLGGVRRF